MPANTIYAGKANCIISTDMGENAGFRLRKFVKRQKTSNMTEASDYNDHNLPCRGFSKHSLLENASDQALYPSSDAVHRHFWS